MRIHHFATVMSVTFLLSLSSGIAKADGSPGVGSGTSALSPASSNQVSTAASPKPGPASSQAVADILKMLDGGVSVDVVRTYIQNSPTPFEMSASDVVMLKQRGVSDDITNAMLKRSGELRGQGGQTGDALQVVSARPPLRMVRTYNGMDPESYDYFYHYYLHPRTLASVYQRLGGYGASYSYGYQPFGYGPMRWAP
jgi:hypothetical protein